MHPSRPPHRRHVRPNGDAALARSFIFPRRCACPEGTVYIAAAPHYMPVIFHSGLQAILKGTPMRAEAQKTVDSIEEALALLRRYL
jgi:hypothetical protein